MKEIGILFTPDNIRAIREGRKTQTRRVMKPQPCIPEAIVCRLQDDEGGPDVWHAFESAMEWAIEDYDICEPAESFHKCPFGHVGDLLYVKEGVILHGWIEEVIGYYLDGCRPGHESQKRRTAMFMPKWAARTWLEIAEVRVERVQDISEEDCIAEGVYNAGGVILDHWEKTGEIKTGYSSMGVGTFPTAKAGYEFMWDAINRKKHPWASNPWVWVLTFKKVA